MAFMQLCPKSICFFIFLVQLLNGLKAQPAQHIITYNAVTVGLGHSPHTAKLISEPFFVLPSIHSRDNLGNIQPAPLLSTI